MLVAHSDRVQRLLCLQLSAISDDDLEILKNQEILAINQDPVEGTSVSPFRWGVNVRPTRSLLVTRTNSCPLARLDERSVKSCWLLERTISERDSYYAGPYIF